MRESELAEAVHQYLAVCLPPEAFHFHVPNEGKRSFAIASAMVRQGMRAGVPDYVIVHRGRVHFLELKSKRGSLSEAQKTIHRKLRYAGCEVVTARTLAEVCLALEAWQIPVVGKVAA